MKECDLVLKGGVTSAVVYLGSVLQLGRTYRLRNIGGTSSGAIAAALAAAAEYRRQTGSGGQGDLSGALEPVHGQLTSEGFQDGIFQAERPMRPALALMRAGTRAGRRPIVRAIAMLLVVVRSYWWATGAIIAAAVALALAAKPEGAAGIALAVTFIALACGAGTLAAVAWLGLRVKRYLDDPEHGFGICPGRTQGRTTIPGVTDWLHEAIQAAAGRTADTLPVTFADLRECGIELELMTTDLNAGMPVTWPLDAQAIDFRFDPAVWRRLFPAAIVEHLIGDTESDSHGLFRLDVEALPILVAVRMSLAFPVLISAVPLHGRDGVRHWFSDGAACSNFPVHLFDTWAPRRPTFGLDIAPWPVDRPAAGGLVRLGGPTAETRWSRVEDLTTFVRQLADAAQNWRDSALAALPGYRERVCRIDLLPGEGGVNIGMDVETIAGLVARGRDAADVIVERFDFDEHVRTRQALLLRLLQSNLHGATEPFESLRESLPPLPPNPAELPEPWPPAALRVGPR